MLTMTVLSRLKPRSMSRAGVRAWCRRHATLAAILISATVCSARAGTIDDDRIRHLEESFRCVVCQNQTLADSNADLAADLRASIREQVAPGATDAQITDFLVRRYGDFVLYRPPFKPSTWAHWLGPFLLCAIGAGITLRLVATKRRPRRGARVGAATSQSD
jgi:cytochrome c-type biogenesis protein CcmH